MEEKIEKINGYLERLETLFESAMRKVNERDKVIKKKDKRITELTDRLEKLQKEKSKALNSKIELMEKFQAETEEKGEKIHEQDVKIREQSATIESLQRKKKDAQEAVLGTSFDRDNLMKKLEEKEKKIEQIEQRVAEVATGSTGILFDKKSVVDYVKERIEAANRQLRLVVPDVEFLEENDLVGLINDLDESCVVNIATAFDPTEQGELIEKWKEKHYRLTQYMEGNLICISANGADVGISFVKESKYSGFYTNIHDLVKIFNQAAMHAFIKGTKI